VVAGFVAAADAAPEELTTIANVMPAPPMPFIAPEHHGRIVVLALVCYAGDADAGERVLAPFRRLAAPVADMLKPMAYHEIYPPEDASYHPTAVGKTMFIDRVDQAARERSSTSSRRRMRRCASCRSESWVGLWRASLRTQRRSPIGSGAS
jgi:hypothetical protein